MHGCLFLLRFATFYAFCFYRSEETWTIQSFTSCVLSFPRKQNLPCFTKQKSLSKSPKSNHFYKFIFRSQKQETEVFQKWTVRQFLRKRWKMQILNELEKTNCLYFGLIFFLLRVEACLGFWRQRPEEGWTWFCDWQGVDRKRRSWGWTSARFVLKPGSRSSRESKHR